MLLQTYFAEHWAMYDWAEFRHFRYLLAILEQQGFRAAAETLHTAQPNLSIQARQFQENATVRLFRRASNGRIHPTEAGVAFIALARFLLETRDEVIDALIEIERGAVGTAHFGSSPFTDPSLFRMFCNMYKELLPSSAVHLTHGDTPQLADEVANGLIDAALVTLPLKHPELKIVEICRDRLVACLRKDHPLARKASLQPEDLQRHLTILYHPYRHPDAHKKLLELLNDAGIQIEEYSRASHPSELQTLVKEGLGFALLRENTTLDDALTTRRIVGVDWTVDTAAIYHAHKYPKVVPILIKRLKRSLMKDGRTSVADAVSIAKKPPERIQDDPRQPIARQDPPVQLKLL
jgi:DNA-binding transcriptional LysR family regulator